MEFDFNAKKFDLIENLFHSDEVNKQSYFVCIEHTNLITYIHQFDMMRMHL